MISKKQEIMSNALEVRHTLSKELPMGYKRTEVGVIPEDWNIMQLADVCIRQGIVRGPFGGSLKKETFATSGFKVYEQRNAIYKSCEVGSYFIDQSKYAEMHRFSVSPGDFIISCSGTIGRIFQIPCEAPKGVINQALLKLSTDQKVVYDLYFYILFEWDDFQMRIIDSTQGGAMKNLVGMDVFRTTPVVLPSLSEQRAIAEALSDVDGLLGALEELIAKKRAIKQAAMQQLLTGKTRLPGFSGKWEAKSFEEVFKRLNAKAHHIQTSEYSTHGLHPVIDQGQAPIVAFSDRTDKLFECLTGGVIVFGDHTRIVKFINMNFLIGADGTQLLAMQRHHAVTKFFFYQLLTKDIPNTGYNRHFKFLQDLTFEVPTSAEQKAIASVLSDMDAEIAALERRWDKARAIKQGMMQQLLTGRVRLVKPTRTKEASAC